MKIKPSLISRFNTDNTVVVISTYPRHGHTYDPKALAVAPFTKNKVNAITKHARLQDQPLKFVILADTIEGESAYVEDDHLVLRCWTRNLLSVYLTIQKAISLFPKAKTVVVEHEFGIFGLKHQITAQLPFFLLLNRLLGKRVILVLHQVIFDLGELAGHLQIDPDSRLTKALSWLIRLNYRLFGLLANHIVVFDSALKEKLSQLVSAKKISAIPLPNSGRTAISHKNQAGLKKQLGLNPRYFYLMYAGYVTWYKGADWLVKSFKRIKKQIKGKPVKLILAGGQSSSLEIDTKYMNWYNHLLRTIGNDKDVEITGVLSEKDLPKYVAAADLLIMPYRLMMSASGPFTLAQTAGTPVIVSSKLQPMTKSTDIKEALKANNLTAHDFIFPMTTRGLLQKINRACSNHSYIKALTNSVEQIKTSRTCQFQAGTYLNLIKDRDTNAKLDLWPKTSPISSTAPSFARS